MHSIIQAGWQPALRKPTSESPLPQQGKRGFQVYDLWFLSRRFAFDKVLLKKAIESTFARRGIKIPQPPEPFTDAFANDPIKQVQWSAFLRRNGLAGGSRKFAEIVETLRNFIAPVIG